MKKITILLFFSCFFFLMISCNTPSSENARSKTAELNPAPSEVRETTASDTTNQQPGEQESQEEVSDYSDYYVVIADTGLDYFSLRSRMMETHKGLDIPIDTMDRYYNKKKDKIVLNENDEDELYRGEYFPRRFPSKSLSLEYMNIYLENSGKKTIALVRGIYESEKEAKNALTELKASEKNAFSIKSRIFTGCLH